MANWGYLGFFTHYSTTSWTEKHVPYFSIPLEFAMYIVIDNNKFY